jgi:uncharacterized protein
MHANRETAGRRCHFELYWRWAISIVVFWKRKISRRKFLGVLGGSGVAGAAGLGYMRFCEPGWLQIGRHEVPVKPGQPRVRVLHLSDFHASPVVSLELIAEAVDLGLSLRPELICLTGDFVTWKYERFPEYSRILKRLSDAAPTFASLGNHDGGRWSARRGYSDPSAVSKMLSDAGISLLGNAAAKIRVGGRDLTVVGVGDMWAHDLKAPKAFAEVKKDEGRTVILLSHNPDSKEDVVDYPWDLMLSGHTHGGQLVLPLIGRPFLPIRDRRFAEGLQRWEDRWIHVTRGVGNLHGMRLNCPPEVSLLTLS